jgi:hypothetical protein
MVRAAATHHSDSRRSARGFAEGPGPRRVHPGGAPVVQPEAQRFELAGTGHLPFVETPPRLADVALPFLAQRGASAK